MALVIVGAVTRPEGSDSYPPEVGTVVPYAFAQPIVDLDEQADEYGWLDLGKLGNLEHLKKHGGHTPYRAGSKRGIVWALDRKMPADFTPWLVAKCASNYETRWLRFWNCDYKQFDNAGNYLGPSGDGHFHGEVEDGHELEHVTLFDDYAREHGVMADETDLTEQQILRVIETGLRGQNETSTQAGHPAVRGPALPPPGAGGTWSRPNNWLVRRLLELEYWIRQPAPATPVVITDEQLAALAIATADEIMARLVARLSLRFVAQDE